MWGVLFLVPFAAPWIGFGVLGLPCKTKVNDGSCSFDNILVEAMQHYKINWLLSSAPTHENISLSAQFQYSLSSCIGQLIHFSGLETSSWPDCAYRLNLLFGDSGLSIHSSPSSFFTFKLPVFFTFFRKMLLFIIIIAIVLHENRQLRSVHPKKIDVVSIFREVCVFSSCLCVCSGSALWPTNRSCRCSR